MIALFGHLLVATSLPWGGAAVPIDVETVVDVASHHQPTAGSRHGRDHVRFLFEGERELDEDSEQQVQGGLLVPSVFRPVAAQTETTVPPGTEVGRFAVRSRGLGARGPPSGR
ncbi:MAG: hypothetical protein KC619_15365 [Myxococcales bacterium]|nr:hypothetical protein [Myxococcales bacterium]